MIDPFVLLAPIVLFLVVALLQFVGCSYEHGVLTPKLEPTFDPPAGPYGATQSVTLSSETAGAVIFYRTDGQDPIVPMDITVPPAMPTQVFSVPIVVSTTTTIKAIAATMSGDRSTPATGEYTIIPIAEVPGQRARGQVDDGLLATATFPNVKAGNLLVVAGAVWRDNGGTTITMIKDMLNTAYTSMEFVSTSDPNYRLFIAYVRAPADEQNLSVTVTTAAAAYTSFGIDEFSGIQDVAPLETDGGGVSGGPSTTPSAPIMTGPNAALILGTMTFHAPAIVQVNPGMGFTQIAEEENNSATNGHTSFNAEFQIVTAAGTYPVSWTLATSSEWDIYRVSFRGWPI